MAGTTSAEEATVNLPLPDRGTPIPSGDHTVWADVSPLLDAACKGQCFSPLLIALSLNLSSSAALFGSRENEGK